MSLLGLKTFRHGVHPPEAKDDTKGMAIRQFPFAPLLVVFVMLAFRAFAERWAATHPGPAVAPAGTQTPAA